MQQSQISHFLEARPPRRQIWAGPKTRKEQTDYLNVMKFVGECRRGERHLMDFQEALTLSDFPRLFQDLLSREMLAMYEIHPKSWTKFLKQGRAPDYRNVRRLALDGAERPLDVVPPNTEINRSELEEENYEYAIQDRGRAIDIPIQVFINNDIDSFSDIPNRLLKAAVRSEEDFVARLLCGPSGPNNTYFNAGNGNVLASNAHLSTKSLDDAMTHLMVQDDKEDQPIFCTAYCLVVPAHLSMRAHRILNASEVRSSEAEGGGDSAFQVLGRNFPIGEDDTCLLYTSPSPRDS